MQRFGSFSISTHEFGKFILNENWQEFVELLLSDQESVAPGSIEARKIWKQTRDPKLTLNKLPHYFVAETAVLRVLQNESPQQKMTTIPFILQILILKPFKQFRKIFV